jgi:hypothetical protein
LEKVLAKKELRPSAVSGIGSMVGVAFGIFMQVLVGVAMVAWIVVDLWLGA